MDADYTNPTSAILIQHNYYIDYIFYNVKTLNKIHNYMVNLKMTPSLLQQIPLKAYLLIKKRKLKI